MLQPNKLITSSTAIAIGSLCTGREYFVPSKVISITILKHFEEKEQQWSNAYMCLQPVPAAQSICMWNDMNTLWRQLEDLPMPQAISVLIFEDLIFVAACVLLLGDLVPLGKLLATLQEKLFFVTEKAAAHDTCEVNFMVSSITMYTILCFLWHILH